MSAGVQAPRTPSPDLARRALLVLTTVLILALPVVPAEDPGWLTSVADPGAMLLTLLWLAAAAAWAWWRVSSVCRLEPVADREPIEGVPPERDCQAGLVEAGLLAVVALLFVSAWAASYQHPALLIAWTWLGMLAVLFVVRQMAITAAERRCLFAVLLASGLSLAAQAVYEQQIQLPHFREVYGSDENSLRQVWEERHPHRPTGDPLYERLLRRVEQTDACATYLHPDSLAAVLALCLPALVLAVVCCWRQSRSWWLTGLLAGGGILTAAALVQTHTCEGLLATGLGILLAAALLARGRDRYQLTWAACGVMVLACLGLLAWHSGALTPWEDWLGAVLHQRRFAWSVSSRLIADHPALGVGPGNFADSVTRYLPEGTVREPQSPQNFVLEAAAAGGPVTGLVLLAVLGGFLVQVLGACWRKRHEPDEPVPEPGPPVRMEFYYGGSLGLLLGFVLRLSGREPEEVLTEALNAGLRSIVWFVSFGLLERLVWPVRLRALALALGVAAALVCLSVSQGIEFGSVAGPMWVAVALAQNSRLSRAWAWMSRRGPLQLLALPVLAALALLFGLLVFTPMNTRYSLQQAALQKASAYTRSGRSSARRLEERLSSLDDILKALREAAQVDPGDAQLRVQMGNWYMRRWLISHLRETAQTGIEQAIAAQQLDPHGWAGYEAEYLFHMLIARRLTEQLERRPAAAEEDRARDRAGAQRQSREAAEAVERYLPEDPNNPVVHYLLAEAYFRADKEDQGREHARRAAELDDLVPELARPEIEGPRKEDRIGQADRATRKLTDRQRKQVRQWLERVPGS